MKSTEERNECYNRLRYSWERQVDNIDYYYYYYYTTMNNNNYYYFIQN